MNIKIISFLLIVLISPPCILRSQCYTVLSIKGEIILQKTGQPIKIMDEICPNDKLIFSTAESKAAVLSPDMGRFIIKLSGKKKDNDLEVFVKKVLVQGIGNLSSRGVISLDNEFGDEYFIAGINKLKIDPNNYPMNEDNFFFIRYKYLDKDVNKKLKYSGDTLFIDKETIYKIDGNYINSKNIESVTLYYYEKGTNTSTKIDSFKLTFADELDLKKELNGYVSILKKTEIDKDHIEEEILLYIMDLYGKINIENMKDWIVKNLYYQ